MEYKFSVCMSIYKNDTCEQVKESIISCIQQTLLPNEIIIVLDGPVKNNILKLIEEIKNKFPNIQVHRLKKNMGLGYALNYAIRMAKYDFIARMDSDDVNVNNRFEKQMNILKKNENIGVVGGWIREFENNIELPICIKNVPETDKKIKKQAKFRCPINHVTIMAKKSEIINSGNYKNIYFNEDYDLWIRLISRKVEFYNIQDVLVNVRINCDTYKRRGGWRYFLSEYRVQKSIYKYKINNLFEFVINVLMRLIIQLIIGNKLRENIYKRVFRRRLI